MVVPVLKIELTIELGCDMKFFVEKVIIKIPTFYSTMHFTENELPHISTSYFTNKYWPVPMMIVNSVFSEPRQFLIVADGHLGPESSPPPPPIFLNQQFSLQHCLNTQYPHIFTSITWLSPLIKYYMIISPLLSIIWLSNVKLCQYFFINWHILFNERCNNSLS